MHRIEDILMHNVNLAAHFLSGSSELVSKL